MTKSSLISTREWRWAISWSVVVLVLSCVPYLVTVYATPEGWQFAGILVNPLDGNSYLAKMRQGFDGNWLFRLTYSPEPHQGAFIFTFYLALGHLAALAQLPLIIVFHLARLIAGFGLLVAAYRFIARVTSDPGERQLAFIFMLIASGLGWLGVMFGAFPIDLWIPEAFVPYSLFANPHFPLSMALMLVVIQNVVWPPPRTSDTLRPRPYSLGYALLTGLAAVALALILPFALLTVWAILVAYLGWFYVTYRRLPWRQIWLTLAVGLCPTPVILYMYWVSISNPVIAGWSAQNVTPAPNVLDFVLGYGLIGILAIIGAWMITRQGLPRNDDKKRGEWLVLLWAAVTIVLIYLPFDLQRRLINGLHIPISILAALGLRRWLPRMPLNVMYRRQVTAALIALSAVGTLFVWILPVIGARQSPADSPTTALLYLRYDELSIMRWLRENTRSDDVILASPRLGMFVPGQTGARAFYGHPFETIEARQKQALTEAFFEDDLEAVSPPVDFIIYGPSEQLLGQPQQLQNYPVVFSVGAVSVYKVVME